MSGKNERPAPKEFPVCPYCDCSEVWIGLQTSEEEVVLGIYFTPQSYLDKYSSYKAVAIGVDNEGEEERMATLEELDRVRYIRCFKCDELLVEEKEVDKKLFDMIHLIGRKKIVRQR